LTIDDNQLIIKPVKYKFDIDVINEVLGKIKALIDL
jgi:hypothetical protein